MKPHIVVLSGAGISAESGLKTFRDSGGLWENHRIEDVATPEAWHRNRALVLRFYNERRKAMIEARPNPGHLEIASWEKYARVSVITQNVDDLHERAGASRLLHMHGEHLNAWCTWCDTRSRWNGPLADRPACPACGSHGLRPDVVWFGEMPYRMEEIYDQLAEADLFAAVGTSGNVYPAAGFVEEARRFGARTLEFNLEPSAVGRQFDDIRIGPASRTLPDWVAEVLKAAG